MQRRTFLRSVSALAAAPAAQAASLQIPLGFDTYSLNRSGWKAIQLLEYPKMPAGEFARFVNLAKKGHPLMAPMLISGGRGGSQPPEYQAALRVQQRVDLERSFKYAREVLDAGIRWRV